jgi:hypothetical protein
MKPGIAISRPQRVSIELTKRVAEFLLEQLGNHQVFWDFDILPGVWTSRMTSRRQNPIRRSRPGATARSPRKLGSQPPRAALVMWRIEAVDMP